MNIQAEFKFPKNNLANPQQTAARNTRFRNAVIDTTEAGVFLILGDLKKYPRKRASSKYRRTKTLARAWHGKTFKRIHGLLGEVVSSKQIAPYNIYVQSGRFQARQHRRLWTNTDERVREIRTPEIHRMYAQNINSALNP